MSAELSATIFGTFLHVSTLQREVLRLEERVQRLQAILRLLFLLLRVSGFSLESTRLPVGDRMRQLEEAKHIPDVAADGPCRAPSLGFGIEASRWTGATTLDLVTERGLRVDTVKDLGPRLTGIA